MFSYMKVYCPICRSEMDGMRSYGKDSRTCGQECYREWQWRETLAIMGKPYSTRPELITRAVEITGEAK